MTKHDYFNNCIQILNSCWNGMSNSRADWKKAIDAFSQVADRADDPQVTDMAIKCLDVLEYRFRGG